VEAFSEANSLDGEPSAPLSVMPTPHKFWRNDKTMECSNLSQFGLTCAVLPEGHGAELLMSFLEASRARTSAPQGKVQESTVPDLASGLNLLGSLARFDPDTSSWRTPQCSLIEDLDVFSETWPRWGSMRNGACWARMTPAPPTSENESGYWRTPTMRDNHPSKFDPNRADCQMQLAHQVAMPDRWPTPRAQEVNGGDYQYDRGDHSKPRLTLKGAVKRFPTPRAADGAHSGTNPTPTATNTKANHMRGDDNGKERESRSPNLKPYSERGWGAKGEHLVNFVAHFLTPRATDVGKGEKSETFVKRMGDRTMDCFQSLPSQVGGELNPPWVELLMGWPLGWTCVGPMSALQFKSWGDGFGTNPGRPEELPALWEATGTETIRGQAGRPDDLHQTEVLFAGLCQQPKASEALGHLSPESQEIQEGCLRSLRLPEGAPSPSCGPESREQRSNQSPDPLQALPRLLAHYGPQAWQDGSWENAIPRVAQRVARRVDRLKAIGNGQVPAVAALAWETLMLRLIKN